MNKLFCGECKSLLNYIRRDHNELVSFETCKKAKVKLPWSKRDDGLLKKLFYDNTAREISKRIGRSILAVRARANVLGLRKLEYGPVWSKKELNLLRKLYPTKTAEEIAERLGRPLQATRARIFRVGLSKRRGWKKGRLAHSTRETRP